MRHVGGLFISQKKKRKDEAKMVFALRNMWLDTYIARVMLTCFKREDLTKKVKATTLLKQSKQCIKTIRQNPRVDTLSYLVKNLQHPLDNKHVSRQ